MQKFRISFFAKLPLRSAFLVLAMTLAALAQTATEIEAPEVNRVARKLKCSCGCNLDMACLMPPGTCPVCKTNKTKIYNMQQSGMNDKQILDRYVSENGKDILIIPPGLGGTIAPYIALALGLGLVFWTIRRYRNKPVALAGGPDIDAATLAKIEEDLKQLD